jgi:putative RNA 2'-phosphotransferase
VPDSDGFVTYKELLQAIHEEPNWRYVRRSHINEVLLGKDRPLFQPEENKIRVLNRQWHIDLDNPSISTPKVLFAPVRRKAHPVVMEKGLKPGRGKYVILSPNKDVASKIGRRKDQHPVLLEIMAGAAESEGVFFFPFGDLFLTPQIPSNFISGPPISKEVLESLRDRLERREKHAPRPVEFTAGSFLLDINRDPDVSRRGKGKKRKGWKEEARNIRRGKRR